MKNVLNAFKNAVTIITIIFILGLFVPMLISTIVVIFTATTFESIISESAIFWLFTLIGWLCSSVYINEALTKE